MALVKLHSFSIAAKHIKELKIGSSRLQGEKLYKPSNPKFPYGERTMDRETIKNQILQILETLNERELETVLVFLTKLKSNKVSRKYNLTKEMVKKILKDRICPVCKKRYVDISYDTEKEQYFFIHYTPSTRYCYIPDEMIEEIIQVSKEQKLTVWYPIDLYDTVHSIIMGYDNYKGNVDSVVNRVVRRFLETYRDLQTLSRKVEENLKKAKTLTVKKYGRGFMSGYAFNLEFDLYLHLLKISRQLQREGIWLTDRDIVQSSIVEYVEKFHTDKYSSLISQLRAF